MKLIHITPDEFQKALFSGENGWNYINKTSQHFELNDQVELHNQKSILVGKIKNVKSQELVIVIYTVIV